VRTRASTRIATIPSYILATLVIFQGVIMLFPITAVTIARNVISKDRRRREREVELAKVFPDVWVQHIIKNEEEEQPILVHRTLADIRGR
jgi:hypothetical protein